MKISIITVCFNSAETIEGTIKSVQGQDYEDIEYFVVDGESTDGTPEILKCYDGQIDKCIFGPDRGIYDAMNKGIHLASGQIVGFLNADDVYAHDSVLAEVVTAFSADHLDAVYGDIVCTRHKDINKVVRYWQTEEYKPRAFFQGWVPPHPTFFCRKCLFQKYGVFNAKYRIAGDFELDSREETIRRIVQTNSFRRLSGGRNRGETNNKSFFRSGTSGRWRKNFTPQTTKLYKKIIGDFLIKFGYEKDKSW